MSMVNVSNLGFGGSGIPDALPQAVAELQNLRLSIVEGAAAGTVMEVAGMDPEDTLGSIVDLTTPADVDVDNCTIEGRNASAEITCLTTAANGDTVVVNGKVYTFREVPSIHTSYNTPPFTIPFVADPSGNDAEDAATRLATAIMSGDSTLTSEVGDDASSPPVASVVTVRVREAGTDGNAYTLTETGTAVTVSGATFSGGTASGSAGFVSTDNLSGKDSLALWYDKNPGEEATPLLAALGARGRGPRLSGKGLKGMRFRGGRKEDEGRGEAEGPGGRDEGRDAGREAGKDESRDDGRNDKSKKPDKPGPGR